MDMSENPLLEAALALWCDYMRSDWTELRPLWYPKESPGLVGNWARGQEAWNDLQDECEGRIVVVVNRAVGDLTPAMRAALEASIGLLSACRVRNAEEMAQEARNRVWRALLAEGCAN